MATFFQKCLYVRHRQQSHAGGVPRAHPPHLPGAAHPHGVAGRAQPGLSCPRLPPHIHHKAPERARFFPGPLHSITQILILISVNYDLSTEVTVF